MQTNDRSTLRALSQNGTAVTFGVTAMTNKDAAREVVGTVIRRNIEITEAGAMDARYRELLNAAEVLDEQAALWRHLLRVVEHG